MGYVIIECDALPRLFRMVPTQMARDHVVPPPERAKDYLRLLVGVLNAGGDAFMNAM